MGLRGTINKEYLQDNLPPSNDQSLTMVAGDTSFIGNKYIYL
jgi:hypothetical protein